MGIISEEQLKKQLSGGTTAPIYVIFGNDGYLKRRYVQKISKMTAEQDDIFNYASFDADCSLQDVYDALYQLPMMAEKKCVVLCDYDFEHCAKADFEKLCGLLADPSDTAVFVLWFDNLEVEPKKNAKFKKIVAVTEKSGGFAVVCDHRRPPELIKMLTEGVLKRGCTFEAGAAKYLVETAGNDIDILTHELEKLCHYRPGGIIGKSEIDALCIRTIEASVYHLSNMIFSRNAAGAMNMLDELFFMRLEPMAIFYTVSAVYIDLFRVYLCKKEGKPLSELAEAFGYKGKEFVLERAAQNLRRLDFNGLCRSFEILTDADRKLKSFGANERVVLEQAVMQLIMLVR